MKALYLVPLSFLALAACAALAPASAPAPAPVPAPAPAPVPDASASMVPDGSILIGVLPTPADAGLAAVVPPDAAAPTSECNDQAPQEFLVRKNFLRVKGGRERAIDYRNQTYGFYGGGEPRPSKFVVKTTFMGLPVVMHQKVVPALKCAEEEIKRTCGDHPYTARGLAGLRFKNTYRGGEVTNHIYGTAIDVDPDRNTCCGCVPPWNNAPRCQRPAKTEYDRMEMPECWVHAFERFGWYWLGHDVLMDTMHFEFLGDPTRILRSQTTAPLPGIPDGGAG